MEAEKDEWLGLGPGFEAGFWWSGWMLCKICWHRQLKVEPEDATYDALLPRGFMLL